MSSTLEQDIESFGSGAFLQVAADHPGCCCCVNQEELIAEAGAGHRSGEGRRVVNLGPAFMCLSVLDFERNFHLRALESQS